MKFCGFVAVCLAFSLVGLSPVAIAQSVSSETETPRTAWGDPDLQGVWNHGTITPLERPAEYGDRVELTGEEVAALNLASEIRATSERRKELTREQDVALAYNQAWWDLSLIHI